jgi:hypothetical protein
LRGVPSITVVEEPQLVSMGDCYIMLVPFVKRGAALVSSPEFYDDLGSGFGFSAGWEGQVSMLFAHWGDETCGEYERQADFSFLPKSVIRSNGHIHKPSTPSHLTSSLITRRDEAGKKTHYREFRIAKGEIVVSNIWIPNFLDFATIEYGNHLTPYKGCSNAPAPRAGSLILDVMGHDSPDEVAREIAAEYSSWDSPRVYLGNVRGFQKAAGLEEGQGSSFRSIDLTGLMEGFCRDKKLDPVTTERLMKAIQNN